MNDNSAKINILARLREALGNKTPNPFPNIENNSFPELNKEDYPEIIFAKKFDFNQKLEHLCSVDLA